MQYGLGRPVWQHYNGPERARLLYRAIKGMQILNGTSVNPDSDWLGCLSFARRSHERLYRANKEMQYGLSKDSQHRQKGRARLLYRAKKTCRF